MKTMKTGKLVEILSAWNEELAYVLAQDPDLTTDDLITPGSIEVFEFLDSRFPELDSKKKRQAVNAILGAEACRTKAKMIEKAKSVWAELGDVCVDDDGCIDQDWQGYPAGTDREDVWHDIEEDFGCYGVTVAKLMDLEPWS